MTKPANLRLEMPKTAEFIDQCRAAFGTDEINGVIRAGMQGLDTFYAAENGHQIGTRSKYAPDEASHDPV